MRPHVHRTYEELLRDGPCVAWFWCRGVMHFVSGAYLWGDGLYPQLNSDEWIEVIW